ncbi:winged helix DNA-binding domain-containing protein [Nonomuraea sp. SYSU D8015]|uniref:winged helix DNA-binding domain-containing protein n=1 Tax=Nonomuraea sp. SYSU D8015 TaxID=2593644 RepID=UPI001660A7A5|nr:winged helix DNA-binding domain-containing protein [Nonomuraea sp. SYSU D8015]
MEVVRHLVAVQGQEPNWPYVGLWTRIDDFRHEQLEQLIHDRSVVRSTVIRRTVHLVCADDFAWLRPAVEPIVSVALRHAYYAREIEGLDLGKLAQLGREVLGGRTLTRRDLGRLLGERFPGRHAGRLADAVELLEPLVHGPSAGVWGKWKNRSSIEVTLAEDWTGIPMAAERRLETMIMRYLAAFGPASVMDVQAWAGVTRLGEVMERLRPRLRAYRNEDGKELFDVLEATLADPDLPAPVRFLPAFDNVLLGHQDRRRMISEEDRKRIAPAASGGVATFLVDGFVGGTWALKGGTVLVSPFRPLTDPEAVLAEAERMLPFIDAHTAKIV